MSCMLKHFRSRVSAQVEQLDQLLAVVLKSFVFCFKMKRNSTLVDNDSDNEIWYYRSDRQLKYSKPRRLEKERTKLSSNYETSGSD